MREGKLWGATEVIEENAVISVHRAEIKAGFCCSRHHHAAKWNGFLVESGAIRIRVYRDNGLEDVTELRAGQSTKVGPGIEHRFEGVEDAVCIEYYWPEMNGTDIVRKDQGGPL